MKRLILPLFAAVAATVIAYANPDRFAPGRYVITMVTNSHNKQRYIDPNEGQLWIDIGADSVRLVKTTILYTPKFGEGESLDLSMEIVSTKESRPCLPLSHCRRRAPGLHGSPQMVAQSRRQRLCESVKSS